MEEKIYESLLYSEYKQYEKYFNWDFYKLMDDYFNSNKNKKDKKSNRIYIPFEIKSQTTPISQEIVDYLLEMEIKIKDDKYGIDKYNRLISIPKFLRLKGQKYLLDRYLKNREGIIKPRECYIVLCRHPYDIIGMSTDRGWKTCFNIRTKENIYSDKYLSEMINILKNGCLVGYLVDKNDLNIKNPISRILVVNKGDLEKPHLLTTDKIYGSVIFDFREDLAYEVIKINYKIKMG